jgi:transposase InsO family protein
VHTFKRDSVNVHEPRDAESVLAQFAAWIDDYNRLAPHSALGMRSPADNRAVRSASRETHAPILCGLQGADH